MTLKKIILVSIIAPLFGLASCGAPSVKLELTKAQALAWETLPTDAYRGKRDSIHFVNTKVGWYGTGKGDLYRTQSGGDEWEKVSQMPGTFIRAVAFIDEDNGFIGNVGTDYYPGVTDETLLYRTRDGGATLTPIDVGDVAMKGICAIDVLKETRIFQGDLRETVIIHAAGRVGGPAGILRSTDGGESWSHIDMSDQAGMILDIKFFSADRGLVFAGSTDDVATSNGIILRTTDGGASWTKVYGSERAKELIWKASFPDQLTGFATVQSYDTSRSQQIILKTTNGGLNWDELHVDENPKARQFGIGFVDKNHGWIGTFDGGYYTADGGASFFPAPVAQAANKFQILRDETGEEIYVFAIGTEVQRLKISHPSPQD